MKNLIVTASVILSCLVCVPSAESSQPGAIVSPADGSTFTTTTVQFQWTAGSGVSKYWLVVGKNPGSSEFYTQDLGTSLSTTVTGLPNNGIRVYARLWSLIGTDWQFQDASYIAFSAVQGVAAQMTTPAPGSTLTASTVQFNWTGGTNVSKYWLWAGSAPGGFELFNLDVGTNLTFTVPGLPTDGSTVYVRLWSFIGAGWKYYDYTYTAINSGGTRPGLAQMTTPAPASTLTSSAVTFQWTGGTGVSDYYLEVGSATDAKKYYGQYATGSLSATVSTLPTDGSIVYVHLWSKINTAWYWNGYTYTASANSPGAAQMTTPPPTSTLTSSTITFQWTGGTGVSEYWLEVGTTATPGQFYSSALTGLSATVSGLPTDGTSVYVRLWSHLAAGWQWNPYTYTASSVASAKAQMTTPAPSSTLTSSTVTFQWTGGTGVSQYWLEVGTPATPGQYYSQGLTGLNATVSTLPTDGSSVYVRLWSMVNGVWQWNPYTYTASLSAPASAQMTTPAPSSTLTSSTVTFQWTGGTNVSEYWLEVGTTATPNQYYTQGLTGLSATVSGLPTNGSAVYVRLWSHLPAGWVWTPYTYTASLSAPASAQMTTPAPSSTLTSSTVTFQWTGGTNVSGYWLEVGTTANPQQFYTQALNSLSATVSGLPTDGSTVSVRLWSNLPAGWQWTGYTYTASTSGGGSTTPAPAQMATPPPSSTLTSSTVTFQWTAGTSVSQYWLEVGTTANPQQFYAQGLTSLSATVSGLPTNGSQVYVRLWSMINGVWQWTPYTYTASH